MILLQTLLRLGFASEMATEKRASASKRRHNKKRSKIYRRQKRNYNISQISQNEEEAKKKQVEDGEVGRDSTHSRNKPNQMAQESYAGEQSELLPAADQDLSGVSVLGESDTNIMQPLPLEETQMNRETLMNVLPNEQQDQRWSSSPPKRTKVQEVSNISRSVNQKHPLFDKEEGYTDKASRDPNYKIMKMAHIHLSEVEEFWQTLLMSDHEAPRPVGEALQSYNESRIRESTLGIGDFLNLTLLLGYVRVEVIDSSPYLVVKTEDHMKTTKATGQRLSQQQQQIHLQLQSELKANHNELSALAVIPSEDEPATTMEEMQVSVEGSIEDRHVPSKPKKRREELIAIQGHSNTRHEAVDIHSEHLVKMTQIHLSCVEEFWQNLLSSEHDTPRPVSEVLLMFNKSDYSKSRLSMRNFLDLTGLLGYMKVEVIDNSPHLVVNNGICHKPRAKTTAGQNTNHNKDYQKQLLQKEKQPNQEKSSPSDDTGNEGGCIIDFQVVRCSEAESMGSRQTSTPKPVPANTDDLGMRQDMQRDAASEDTMEDFERDIKHNLRETVERDLISQETETEQERPGPSGWNGINEKVKEGKRSKGKQLYSASESPTTYNSITYLEKGDTYEDDSDRKDSVRDKIATFLKMHCTEQGITLSKAFQTFKATGTMNITMKEFIKTIEQVIDELNLTLIRHNKTRHKNKIVPKLQINKQRNPHTRSPPATSGKSKEPIHPQNINNREQLRSFFKENYVIQDDLSNGTEASTVFQHYNSNKAGKQLTYSTFLKIIVSIPEIKSIKRGASKIIHLNILPSKHECHLFHQASLNINAEYTESGSEVEANWSSNYFREDRIRSSHQNKRMDTSNDNLKQFLDLHYASGKTENTVDIIDMFSLYQKTRLYQGETIQEFQEKVAANHNIVTIVSGTEYSYSVPLEATSRTSKTHHLRLEEVDRAEANSINLRLVNIRGLITRRKNKSRFVRDITKDTRSKHQIIAITETWTKDIHEKEITEHFPGYHILKVDREFDPDSDDPDQIETQGGTLILTSSDITITPTKASFSNGNCEVLIAHLPTINGLIVTLYRPSGKNFSLAKYSDAVGRIQKYLRDNEEALRGKHIMLMGDFNFPKKIVQWKESKMGLVPDFQQGKDIQKQAFEQLLTLTEEYQMEQIVNQPTRGKNILDLVFTNQPHLFGNCSTTKIKPQSDHDLVNFTMLNPNCVIPTSEEQQSMVIPEIAKFNFPAANEEELHKSIGAVKWKEVLAITPGKTVDMLAETFINKVVEIAKRDKVPKFVDKNGNFTSPYHQKLLNRRLRCSKMMNHPHCTNKEYKCYEKEIEQINTKIQETHEGERQRLERKAIDAIQVDAKAFFKFANKTRKAQTKVGPLKQGSDYYSGPQQMANILSAQYKSVFSKPRLSYNNIRLSDKRAANMEDLILDKNMFLEAMNSMKPWSAPGPDGVPAFFYYKYANELAEPLLIIWKHSLDTGKMPEPRLLAYITPILKSTDRSVPANYRPVSLTNHMTKIFERVVRKHITHHLETNNFMNRSQHGFRQRHSTITQLLTYMDSVLNMMEEGNPVDAIYLDFSKAFDKVDHCILMMKVENLGIKGKVLAWLKEFLTNRQQQVRVDCHLSEKEWVRSGVPQGSVLGPLLFIIMMEDIDRDIEHSEISSYADDTRIWRFICGESDQMLLQGDLNSLYNWADENNATFNGEKFEGISYPLGLSAQRIYKDPNNQPIQNKELIKDLGVYISSDGTFKEHIKIYVKETQKIAAWTLRTFLSREKRVMKVLLKQLIIPKIEYASVVWCPFDKQQIDMIESIQRRYTSCIQEYQRWEDTQQRNVCQVDYWDRLKDLNIYSLERRRERFVVLCVYRVLIGLMAFQGFEVYLERGVKIKPKYNKKAPQGIRKIRHSSFFLQGSTTVQPNADSVTRVRGDRTSRRDSC